MPRQTIQPKQATRTGVVGRGRSNDPSRSPYAAFEAWPDDGVADRNVRASRKPGLLAVLGFRVPARPIWIGGILVLGAIALLAWDAFRQPPTVNEAPPLRRSVSDSPMVNMSDLDAEVALVADDVSIAPSATLQSVTINARPENVAVSVDGMTRGTTPLKLTLAVGKHLLEVQRGEDRRSIQISVEPGTDLSQFIDFGPD